MAAAAGGLIRWLSSRWSRMDGSGRLSGIDLARGIAVIGMFAAHLLVTEPWDWSDPATWTDLANGRSSILFATLAGVSLALVTGGRRPYGPERMMPARGRIAVRAFCIYLLGIFLVALSTPILVILPAYAILFVLALPVLRLPSAWLFALAAVLAVTTPFVLFAVESWPFWSTPGGRFADAIMGWHYPFLVWSAFLAAGLGIGRLRLTRPAVAGGLLLSGAVLALVGYGLIAPAAAELTPGSMLAFVASAEPHSSGMAEVIGSGGFAIAAIGVCLLLCATPVRWILLPLRAVGSMALTAYTGQLVAWWLLQPETGPAGSELSAFRELDPFWTFTFVTVVACTAWTLLIGRGPLEWAVSEFARLAAPDPGPRSAGGEEAGGSLPAGEGSGNAAPPDRLDR